MAENVGDIELKDLDRERQQVIGEEETSFMDNDRKPGDESILIIDGSSPVFTRVPMVHRHPKSLMWDVTWVL